MRKLSAHQKNTELGGQQSTPAGFIINVGPLGSQLFSQSLVDEQPSARLSLYGVTRPGGP